MKQNLPTTFKIIRAKQMNPYLMPHLIVYLLTKDSLIQSHKAKRYEMQSQPSRVSKTPLNKQLVSTRRHKKMRTGF